MVTFVEPPEEPSRKLAEPKELLLEYLDYYRDALLRKLDGMSEEALRNSVLPSGWTPVELLKHLTYVERRWFRWGLLAEPVDDPWGENGPDGGWRVGADEPVQRLVRDFREVCARSREICRGARLDQLGEVGGRFETEAQVPTFGWILCHLFQEYARHVGQLDVVRELTDGHVGE